MPNSFQSQYSFSFALIIFCISFLNMSTSQHVHSADNVAPPQRIVAYVCMNPKCEKLFTNLFSYDQHRYHARNVGTLCASLTMRREIVATRRAGVTTSVIKRIPPKGKPCACICCNTQFQKIRTSGKISTSSSKVAKIRKNSKLIRTSRTPDMVTCYHVGCSESISQN